MLALIAGILGAVAIKKSKKGLGIAGLLLSLGGLGLGLYVQVSTIMAAKEIAQGAEAALKDLQAAQQ